MVAGVPATDPAEQQHGMCQLNSRSPRTATRRANRRLAGTRRHPPRLGAAPPQPCWDAAVLDADVEAVTETSHRHDETGARGILLDLDAQAMDVDVEDAAVAGAVSTPYPLE